MSVPRITQILEEQIQAGLDSKDEATRVAASSAAISFAILRELRKIRMIAEDETGTEIPDDDLDDVEDEI